MVIMSKLPWTARQHVEQYGLALARNTHLSTAVALIALALLGSIGLNLFLFRTGMTMKPLLISRDALGRPHVETYDEALFRTTDEDIRVYLTRFFELRYQKMRRTITRDQANVLWFLDERLRTGAYDTDAQVRAFLTDPTNDEVEVAVRQVVLDDPTPGERAALVDYDLIYLDRQQQEHRRDRFTERVLFHLTPVPDEAKLTNLIGLQITRHTPVPALTN